jgi:hypothetical protein
MVMVKVRVTSEQLQYTNSDGDMSHYFRGSVLEMEEEHALNALTSHRPAVELVAVASPVTAPAAPPKLDPEQARLDAENAIGKAKAEAAKAADRAKA